MGAADIDRLEVEIEASAVKANRALDAFISKLEKLSSSVGKINGSDLTGFANGIEKICKASSGMSNIKTSDFTRLSKNIEKIASINTASINATSSALGVMAKQLSSFSAASTNASAISEFAKNIFKLGNKGVTSAMANMPKFATAFNQMMVTISKAPQMSKNIIDMTNALANLAQGLKGTQSAASQTGGSASKLSKVLNTLTTSTQKSGRSFKSFAQIAGSFYANFFMVARGIQKAWKAVMSSMDYVETFNYWNVAIDKIGTEFGKQFEQYGYDSAEAYANSFAGRLKTLTLKMTGYEIGDVGDLSLTGNKNLGLDPEQLMNYQAKIVSVTNAVGLCGETSTNTAKALSMLAADMSSYTNEDLSSVMTNFQSGLIGQSRALYKFGIDITNATLQQYAYNLGVTKSLSAMTQAEKMQLRLIAILDQSKVAWGDQANTLGSVANQYRIMKQQVSNLARTIGNLFLPIIKNVLPVINAMVMALNRLFTTLGFHFFGSNWLKDLQDGTSKGYGTGLEDLGEDADDAADSLGSAANAAKKLKDVTLGIDELNINDPTSDSGSSGSGSGAGGGVDLSGAIADALKDYETVWDRAFAESENKAQKIADAICSAFKRGDYEGIGTYISNGISSALEKINWESVYGVARDFGSGFAQFLNGLITPRLFGNVGTTIAGALNTAIYTALSFGETFDWNNLGNSIAEGINKFFSTFDFKSAGKALNTFVKGLKDAIKEAIKKVKWKDVFDGIKDFLSELDVDTVAILISAFTLKYAGKVLTSTLFKETIASLIANKFAGAFGASSVTSMLSYIIPITVSLACGIASVKVGKDSLDKANDDFKKSLESGSFSDGFSTGVKTTLNPFGWIDAIGGGIISGQPDLEWLKDMPNQEDYKNLDDYNKALDNFNKNLEETNGQFSGGFSLKEWIDEWKALNGLDDVDLHAEVVLPNLQEKIGQFKDNLNEAWGNFKFNLSVEIDNIKEKIAEKWGEAKQYAEDNIFPWFTKEKWIEIGNGIKDGLSEKWNEFSEWWSETGIVVWWDENVAPWFTKEKWNELGDNVKNGLSEKWEEFDTWWTDTGFYKWWNSDVAPWFTKEKWSTFGTNIKDGLSGKWNEFSNWWEDTGFYKWWNNDVKPKFTKQKWTFDGVKDGLGQAFENAIAKIKEIWNGFADWFNQKMQFSIPSVNVFGHQMGGGTVSLGNLPKFAEGGFPETGQLFMARENGLNEMVGRIGNRNAVANNDQIVEAVSIGVSRGVADAVGQILSPYLSQIAQNTREVADKDMSVNIGDKDIARANIRGQRAMGLTLRTT
jgi:histone H3/H4